MTQCRNCSSYAINFNEHGRDPKLDLDLCDVCYWKGRVEQIKNRVSDFVRTVYGQDNVGHAEAVIRQICEGDAKIQPHCDIHARFSPGCSECQREAGEK